MALDPPSIQCIDGDPGAQARPHAAGLGFLEIGCDPTIVGHEGKQLRAARHVLAQAHADLAQSSALGRAHDGVLQVDPGGAPLSGRAVDLELEARPVDRDGAEVLLRDLVRRLRLIELRPRVGERRARLIQFADGNRAIADELGDAFEVGLRAQQLRLRVEDGRSLRSERGHPRGMHLVEIGERGLLRLQRRAGLVDLGSVLAIVDAYERLSLPDIGEVRRVDGHDVATDLRRNDGGAATNIGVVGDLHAGAKRRQLPGAEHRQHDEAPLQDDERHKQRMLDGWGPEASSGRRWRGDGGIGFGHAGSARRTGQTTAAHRRTMTRSAVPRADRQTRRATSLNARTLASRVIDATSAALPCWARTPGSG